MKLLLLSALIFTSCFKEFDTITYFADKHKIPKHIALGLIKVESNFNPKAKSHCNARGLTQVIPKWHRERCNLISDDDLYNPEKNLDCGLSYLRELYLETYSISEALAMYNVGPNNYKKYSSSRVVGHRYANKVLNKSKEYIL